MKLTYFGTAAAEGFPALFCNCPHCNEARRLGGKNIRSRSQAMINTDLLIDLPPDTYTHFLQNAVEGDRIAYLLITHTHSDHFAPADLMMRRHGYAQNMRVPTLQILCSADAARRIGTPPPNTEITVLTPYVTVTVGGYRITPLPARHEENALIYLIEGERTILYGHDTGFFFDEVITYLADRGVRLDMISLDCTNVDIPIADDGRHMGLPNIGRLLARLEAIGAVGENTLKYINHFSHNAAPLQELLEKKASAYGCMVAYDGCTVEI